MINLSQLINRKMPVELSTGIIHVPELTTKEYLNMIEIEKLTGLDLQLKRIEFASKILNRNDEKVKVNAEELPFSFINAFWNNLVEFTFLIVEDPN